MTKKSQPNLATDAGKIPDFREDGRWQTETAKLRQLEDALKQAESRLHATLRRPGEKVPPPDLDEDVRALLEGRELEPGLTRETHHETYVRRRDALAEAVRRQKQLVTELRGKLIAELCEACEPLVRPYALAIIEAMKHLQDTLQRAHAFHSQLNAKGFRTSWQPPHWQLSSQQEVWLFGSTTGRPSLSWEINRLQAGWGLDEQPARRKKVS